jgi:GDPmannose 4,6-dehydratase
MFRIVQLNEPGDFVVSSGELHSVREFVEAAFEEVGLNWREHVQIEPGLLKRVSQPLRGNSAKLRSRTGWSPTVRFRELVGKLVLETEKLNATT